ncbi:hormogonium polysaccharide biosynthesis protein HpsA [Synechocystis sp. PCC 7509]|uniref:hormogonium polysaccharide biosynthesis protein HpsA n=1 Tax=Synechocystis sp. PCC 7509 TaxID=927677 RepID=UPI0002AC106E|nr:hormogonium polysaccharide biosynthesis protein HpsA [Synechocystis sp. PCC 7509]
MSTNKQDKTKQNLLKQIEQLSKTDLKQQIQWLLRGWIVGLRQQPQAGFVLPTVVLVLLVVGLTVAALLFRSLSRTTQVIGQREQQQIYNAATPAIDRAKAKLEYLFKDGKLPSGIPPEGKLAELMQENVYNFPGKTTSQQETRLNLDGNTGTTENAWMYQDAEGNTIAYSILMKAEEGTVNVKTADLATKASSLVVRSGPVSTVQPSSACANAGASALEKGWFKDGVSTGFLRKNFQVNAVVLKNGAANQTATTLEFQQERQVDRGNKWGAWFLNDLEVFPGPEFNWNGSMHTEGTIFIGSAAFKAHLISAPNSCLYGVDGLEASEISMKDQPEVRDPINPAIIKTPRFQGQIISGTMKDNTFVATVGQIDRSPTQTTTLGSATDSVRQDTVGAVKLPVDIALDALSLLTEDKSEARKAADPNNTTARDTAAWDTTNPLAQGATQRVFNKAVAKPYVDDSYRADNRYGPKIPKGGLPAATKVGDPISSTLTELVSNDPIAGNIDNVGLDGYWERRSRNQGLRIIVGQRLELGNPLAAPGSLGSRPHEALQRRTLRDNLAAVQATAIYFHENVDTPVACLATAVHPGTADSLKNSATFRDVTFNVGGTPVTLKNDFFTGRGTNGWEYTAPSAGGPNAAQLIALKNLANYSGDPNGAFPPKQEASTSTVVHPYPLLTQNGDFSNLRRALTILAGSSYADLSTADKTYIDTANCSLGMLADEIKKLKDYSYTNAANIVNLTALNSALAPTAMPVITGATPEEVTTKLFQANLPIADTAWLVYLKEQIDRDRRNNVGYVCSTNLNPSALAIHPYPYIVAKLCPPITTPIVPKYEALSYIFPTANRNESRADTYLNSTGVNPTTLVYQGIGGTTFNTVNDDTALESIRLTPQPIANWKLDPATIASPGTNAPNDKTNNLIKYTTAGGVSTVYRIPFKDTALFNGREMMSVRVLNIDLDLLRQNQPYAADTWLPASGLVFAFREDAVREDGIARPPLGTWPQYKSVWDANTASGPPETSTGTPSQIWRMDAVTPKDPPLNGSDGNGAISAGGTGISPKPIDYYPDPARRPYGFRLKQGTTLARTVVGVDNTFGLSFISDNTAYIQGDFNLHKNSSNTLLEEFTQLLTYGTGGFYSNFYTRTTPSTEFAKPAIDSWRPTEIIADAITILSNSFCDGSIEDGLFVSGSAAPSSTTTISEAKYGCGTGNIATSYLNQNRPTGSITFASWLRENIADDKSPIVFDSEGAPRTGTATPGVKYAGAYQAFTNGKQRNIASVTRINAVLISGLVPSRQQQAYGGLHNFPRFLETWNGNPKTDLYLSGSFIQLNFSTSATAPFDQDSWEKLDTSDANEPIEYYGPPNRRWGYDVALQFQAPGAVSQRFTTISSIRSEFYRELPVDDPYIRKLRCATIGATSTKVDPKCS